MSAEEAQQFGMVDVVLAHKSPSDNSSGDNGSSDDSTVPQVGS